MRILAAARLKTLALILALEVAHLLSAIRKKQSSELVLFCLHLSKKPKGQCSSVPAVSFPNDLPVTAKEDLGDKEKLHYR